MRRGRRPYTEGLGGFWSDLIDQAKDAGSTEIKQRVGQRFGADHIGAQNDAAREITGIVEQLHVTQPTRDELLDAAARVTDIAAKFYTYATQPQFGARGRQGAAEIRNWAARVAADIRRDAAAIGGGSPLNALKEIPGWVWAAVAALLMKR